MPNHGIVVSGGISIARLVAIEGVGFYSWFDSRKYVGEWRNFKMHGCGLSVFKQGKVYKGNYFNDKKEGFGVLIQKDGKRFEGNWEGGIQKQLGRSVSEEGEVIGYWNNKTLISAINDSIERVKALDKIKNQIVAIEVNIDRNFNYMRLLFSQFVPDIDFDTLMES